MAKKEHEEEHENLERWLISYADMITLMFAFFVMLFAMSQLDLQKMEQFRKGAAGATGGDTAIAPVAAGGTGVMGGGVAPDQGLLKTSANSVVKIAEHLGYPTSGPELFPGVQNSEQVAEMKAKESCGDAAKCDPSIAEAKDKIEQTLQTSGQGGLVDSVNFRVDDRGLVVTVVTDEVAFDSGKAELLPEGADIIAAIAGGLSALPNEIEVAGHTDNVPFRSDPSGNWGLSTRRGLSVLEALAAGGVPTERMHVTGYADTKPLADNGDPGGRSRNRRVEIVVMNAPGASATVHEGEPTDGGGGVELPKSGTVGTETGSGASPTPSTTAAPAVAAPGISPNLDPKLSDGAGATPASGQAVQEHQN